MITKLIKKIDDQVKEHEELIRIELMDQTSLSAIPSESSSHSSSERITASSKSQNLEPPGSQITSQASYKPQKKKPNDFSLGFTQP